MSLWTDIIAELIDEDSGQDTMVIQDLEGGGRKEGETAKEERMRIVEAQDVIRRVDIKVAVKEAVQNVVGQIGREAFEGWVADVDGDVVGAFGRLGVV